MARFKNAEGVLKNEIAEKIEEREWARDYLLNNLTTEDFYCLSILLGEAVPWDVTEKKELLFKIQPKG